MSRELRKTYIIQFDNSFYPFNEYQFGNLVDE